MLIDTTNFTKKKPGKMQAGFNLKILSTSTHLIKLDPRIVNWIDKIKKKCIICFVWIRLTLDKIFTRACDDFYINKQLFKYKKRFCLVDVKQFSEILYILYIFMISCIVQTHDFIWII